MLTFESISKDPNSKSTIWKRDRMEEIHLVNKRSKYYNSSVNDISENELLNNKVLCFKLN